MIVREIRRGVSYLGAVDFDRRLFDAFVPLPDGTSYNAYVIRGSEKTALLDTVDPTQTDQLMAQLETVESLDYLVAHHAEQDHSGSIPAVLARYPGVKVVCTPRCKELLMDLLQVPEQRVITVADGDTLSLGDKTLVFFHMPWVHWPDTCATYLPEEKILFTCDFLGSHLATTDVFASEEQVYEPAKRYYAEIMMPFRQPIKRHLQRIRTLAPEMIAPGHGPVHQRPTFILDAYEEWASDTPHNIAVLAYVSMHGSTRVMVDYLQKALVSKGVKVERFDLTVTDVGKLAMALVDAATLVLAAPAVLVGPHPAALYAANVAAILKPKLQQVAVISSYGWGNKVVEELTAILSKIKAEALPPVIAKGLPKAETWQALNGLAATIAARHQSLAPA